MKIFIKKLLSRKFITALAGVFTGLSIALGADASDVSLISGSVVSLLSAAAYIITEGKVDAVGINAVQQNKEE